MQVERLLVRGASHRRVGVDQAAPVTAPRPCCDVTLPPINEICSVINAPAPFLWSRRLPCKKIGGAAKKYNPVSIVHQLCSDLGVRRNDGCRATRSHGAEGWSHSCAAVALNKV